MKIWSAASNFNRKSEVVLQKIAQFYYRDCHLITQVIHLLFLWRYHGTIWEQQTH